ncbi:MAG: hypothetical protein K0M70_08770 [Arenimonas sp.]|uniref:hypothetical protein n=1 Tax=Arenimonas sp. TaxID=1872635 RepID=UPI0025BC3733|nr:hypothetical protein [Arenimonas sp.]MBW8367936.1 hypothetical protein [Arenimonas sp.]
MSPGVSHALEQALAYYRTPALLAKAPQRPLPDDVIELLRLAAGDAAQAAQSAEASGESPQRVVEAAVFFVQQVMFTAQADAHRVLGVNPDAPAARIREHFHWLIRWLHPDRNDDDWDSVYSDRVTRAWQALRRGGALAGEGDAVDAGAEADAEPPMPGGSEPPDAAKNLTVLAAARLARISRETPAMAPIVSARTARHLPAFVLGGLALAAVSLVALLWYAQQQKASGGPRAVHASAPAGEATPTAWAPAPAVAQSPLPEPAVPEAPAAADVPAPVALVPGPSALGPPPPWPADQPPLLSRTAMPPPVRANPATATQLASAAPPARPAPEPAPASVSATAMASTPATAPQAAPVAQSSVIPQESARALLSQFTDAYTAGNIQQLMALFTRDAVNNRGGRDAIAYDYQSLFAKSRERRLTLWPSGWVERENEVVVLATYEAFVKEGRVLPGSTTRGAIRFTLRRENGELRISKVRHE